MRCVVAISMLATVFAISACASKPAPGPTSLKANTQSELPVEWPLDPSKPAFSPACKLEGCCEGHGEVALLQPDRFVMCTDGEPSRICDCH